MRKILLIIQLLVSCLIINAQEITKKSVIFRDSLGCVTSIDEEEFKEGKIISIIHFIVDKRGNKVPSYRIEYSMNISKISYDSILTYHEYKGEDCIQDKIVTYSFDKRNNRLISQRIQDFNSVDVVYPNEKITLFKYNRYGKLIKARHGQGTSNKMTYNYVDKVSYYGNNVTVKRFFLPSYDNKGNKRIIPKREYEICLKSMMDDRGRVVYQNEINIFDSTSEILRCEYDDYDNLIKKEHYSQTNKGELLLFSELNDIEYESGRILKITHYREDASGVKTITNSEEYKYE